MFEQVLREGNEDDIRRFIGVDELIDRWDDLVLPRHVHRAQADWMSGWLDPGTPAADLPAFDVQRRRLTS